MPEVKVARGKYKTLESDSAIHKALTKDGFHIFSWMDSPGAYYAPHSHPHDEYIVVTGGRITIKAGGQVFELASGDALTLPAGTVHEAFNYGNEPARYLICTR